jgi:hypothetical protein
LIESLEQSLWLCNTGSGIGDRHNQIKVLALAKDRIDSDDDLTLRCELDGVAD